MSTLFILGIFIIFCGTKNSIDSIHSQPAQVHLKCRITLLSPQLSFTRQGDLLSLSLSLNRDWCSQHIQGWLNPHPVLHENVTPQKTCYILSDNRFYAIYTTCQGYICHFLAQTSLEKYTIH